MVKIECQTAGYHHWEEMKEDPIFDWVRNDYRVKPEIREGWVTLYKGFSRPSTGYVYYTEKEALENTQDGSFVTVKITWEE